MTVAANNTRLNSDVGANNNDLSSIGGGAGAESTDDPAAFFYQGSGIIYRKVTATGASGGGFTYTHPSTTDMTAAATRTMMCKINVTDFGGLNTANGLRLRIGDGSYRDYVLAGTDGKINALQKYPAKGGFIIMPIDPNITAYYDTNGGPTLSAIDEFSAVARFASASAKAENLGLDIIDLGTGLTITGTSVALIDFVDTDEGTLANRWGYATLLADGVFQAFGTWVFGTATAVTMTDTTRVSIIFPDGLFQAGWSGLDFDLQNASTDITLTNKDWKGLGTTAVEDTRPVLLVTGTDGSLTLNNSVFTNYASMTFTSGVVFDGNTILESEAITQAGATITNNICSGNVNANAEALFTIDDLSLFTKNYVEGDGTGYMADLGTISSSGTISWDNTFNTSNFAAVDGSTGNEVILVNYTDTGADLVISVAAGASTPTIHNTGAGTVDVQAGLITLAVTVLDDSTGLPITDARVHLHKSGTPATVYINKETNVSGVASEDIAYDADTDIVGWARQMDVSGTDYTPKDFGGEYTSAGFSITIRLEPIT
ncbi:MAG: hypothetical protein DRQ42_04180 [Gammaproteobacteria bacterium]|nr:MAG: hypothetical protein DRQ42_04180 [Gammaproteobacteria bacterium]